jgi:hypothetical protein
MVENTHPTPGTSAGYAAEGRELEQEALENSSYPVTEVHPLPDDEAAGRVLETESLSCGEPARVCGDIEFASAGDTSEMLGEVLQSQELNPAEPAVTNEPVPLEGAAPTVPAADAGYVAEGRAMERENLAQSYPGQPIAPGAPATVANHQAAYQAAYGAPSAPSQSAAAACQPGPGNAGVCDPQAAVRAATLKKQSASLDPERVFLICGMAVGAIMIVFGLCMLAFYTPAEVSEFFDSYRMNGTAGWSETGATAQQILKAGFSMLLIGLGATDICAFGAKLMKGRKHQK